MKLEIIWSEFAEFQLDDIFEYYKVSISFAKKLLKEIINEPEKLINSPLIGQVEELLKGRSIEYRYLVLKNYKLIYSIDSKNKFIKIADVFGSRQYPEKLKRTK
jgi:plasmid stabilization system protein ParE